MAERMATIMVCHPGDSVPVPYYVSVVDASGATTQVLVCPPGSIPPAPPEPTPAPTSQFTASGGLAQGPSASAAPKPLTGLEDLSDLLQGMHLAGSGTTRPAPAPAAPPLSAPRPLSDLADLARLIKTPAANPTSPPRPLSGLADLAQLLASPVPGARAPPASSPRPTSPPEVTIKVPIVTAVRGIASSEDKPTPYVGECVWCKEPFVVYKDELACQIFRHAAFRATGEPVPPHLPKAECEALLKSGTIVGCCKPLRFNGTTTEPCDYI